MEERYTLEEAERILRQESCRDGHVDLHEVVGDDGSIPAIFCANCNASYKKDN